MDDLHSGGILEVVRTGDCSVTWSVSVHSIGSGSQVYSSFLGEFPTGHGDMVDDDLSSLDGRSVREDHPNFKGHAMSMCPRSQGELGRAFNHGGIRLQ